MDWIDSFLNTVGLNGSTAPNSGAIPLSTPVNTSGGNTSTSGNWFSSLIGGLSGAGTSAAQAYTTIFGTAAQQAAAKPATAAAAPSLTTYLPMLIIGGVILVIGILLFRKR